MHVLVEVGVPGTHRSESDLLGLAGVSLGCVFLSIITPPQEPRLNSRFFAFPAPILYSKVPYAL